MVSHAYVFKVRLQVAKVTQFNSHVFMLHF